MGDHIRVSWTRQTDIDYYELRRGDASGWANATVVYVGNDSTYETREWVPTIGGSAVETWMLRVYGLDGSISRTVTSSQELGEGIFEYPYREAQVDHSDGSWGDGTLSNLVDSGGNLVLDTGQTSGTYTTDTVTLDEWQPAHVNVLCMVDRTDSTSWNEAQFAWDSDYARKSDWTCGYFSTTLSKQWSTATDAWEDLSAYTWETYTNTVGSHTIEIRTSDDGVAWGDWETYTNAWRNLLAYEVRITLASSNSLYAPKLKELQISVGTQIAAF